MIAGNLLLIIGKESMVALLKSRPLLRASNQHIKIAWRLESYKFQRNPYSNHGFSRYKNYFYRDGFNFTLFYAQSTPYMHEIS
jgi:hypothetical protein